MRALELGCGAGDQFPTYRERFASYIGIDVSKHTPNTIADLHDTSFDLIITLSPEAHHQALELTRTMAVDVEYWPTIDATVMLGQETREQTLMHYRAVRDQLFERIKTRFAFEGGPTV